MKTAILGGKGYIGSFFHKTNYNIDVFDRAKIGTFFDNIDRYDSIVHLADTRLDNYTEEHKTYYKSLNSKIVSSINNKTFLLFLSSCSVYGIGENITEWSETKPTSLYSESKLMSEKILQEHPNTLIFRMGTVFGPSPNLRKDLLINNLTTSILSNKSVDIFSPEDYRPFLYIKDVYNNIFYALDNRERFSGSLINLVSFNISKFDLVREIVKNLGSASIRYSMEKEKSTRNYIVSNTYSLDMGFKYNYTLETAMSDFVNALSS